MTPVDSRVHKLYTKLKREGYSKGKATRIAQSATEQALKTESLSPSVREGRDNNG